MRCLLDTHTFIWLDSDPAQLSPRVRALCYDPANTLLLSVASVWEMQIKLQLGKLILTQSLAATIASQRANGINLLPISVSHVLGLDSLPLHHKDPFDRMLIAQANVENIALLSADRIFTLYSVALLW